VRRRRTARMSRRRRALLLSAPVLALAVAVAGVLVAAALAGRSAQRHVADHDAGGLRRDVAVLETLRFLDPASASFAAGNLAVLDDRLEDADAAFADAVDRGAGGRSCPARVDLELVRERLADIDAWEGRPDRARERYRAALTVIEEAPPNCFAGNDDPDDERRAVRNDAAARVNAKLRDLGTVAPPPPPPPAVAAPPPPATVAAGGEETPDVRRLDPGRGDPQDVLRRLLGDSAAAP
jgi:hypothetical protein